MDRARKDPITLNDCYDYAYDNTHGIWRYNTTPCGTFRITKEADENLREDDDFKGWKYKLAGSVREMTSERNPLLIRTDNIQQIVEAANPPSNPLESVDRIVLFLLDFGALPYEYIKFDWLEFTLVYARNFNEFEYYLNLSQQLGYTETRNNERDYRLTIDGWKRANELRNRRVSSSKAFVAMWFDLSMNDAWQQGFKPALDHTGYIPIKIDLIEHNDKIDDRIIAEIRKSGLLVADFTGQRGGVYFEAGFAMGLGIPVIWTCQRDEIDKVHFDTRQYSHVVWDEPNDLRYRLVARIEATIARIRKKSI